MSNQWKLASLILALVISVPAFAVEVSGTQVKESDTSVSTTEENRLVPVDNSLIFINFMNRLRAKRTDSLTNRFFLLSIRPV